MRAKKKSTTRNRIRKPLRDFFSGFLAILIGFAFSGVLLAIGLKPAVAGTVGLGFSCWLWNRFDEM